MSSRFNEAGPQGAGKPHVRRSPVIAVSHASMRPARKGPENLDQAANRSKLDEHASMRPARKGPENRCRA